MPTKGRPPLTPEAYQARLTAYCAKYGVTASETGIPPFPSGRRETAQHREWIALYKVHQRLQRPATPAASGVDRRVLLAAQHGLCPICARAVDLADAIDDTGAASRPRALLHSRCRQLVRRVEALGPEAFNRLRAYVWPRK